MLRRIISIVIADDTLIAREGWQRILETTTDIVVRGETFTVADTIRRVVELRPDILLMDLKWYGDENAAGVIIKEIKKLYPEIKIIGVTAHQGLISKARLAGVDATLLKTFTREELIGVIRDQATRSDNESTLLTSTGISESLTERELQILVLLSHGHNNKEIAHMLGIAPTTTKHHLKSVLKKLNARNRTQAVSIARDTGIIESSPTSK